MSHKLSRLSSRLRAAPVLLVFAVAALLLWRWFGGAVPQALTALGYLEADEVNVTSEVTARVLEVRPREGDQVLSGATVLRLDDNLVQLQREQASPGLLQQLAIQQAKYTLAAPITGTVLRRTIEPGEVAVAGAPLLTLADLSSLNLKVYVLQRDMDAIRSGDTVRVEAEALPGIAFGGVVTYLSDKAEFTPRNVQTAKDRLNLVFAVKVRIDNAAGRLKPGMSALVHFAE